MKEKQNLIIAIIIVFLVVGAATYFTQASYYSYSLERHKLCLVGAKALSESGHACSQITAAADSAFSWSTSHVLPMFVILISLATGLAYRTNKLEKEVHRLKEALDA